MIVKMIFGSYLYGTATKSSDQDFKGVELSAKEEILLGNIPKSKNLSTSKSNIKNTAEDIDTEIYSLHYFFKLALRGETIALDMLHAPQSMLIETSSIWEDIVKERSRFYTKNLRAFIGYARRQAAKYGIKGSRLNAATEFLQFLNVTKAERLSEIWETLVEDEHRHFVEDNPNGVRQYQVCGKILQETMTIGYAYSIVERFHNAYGERAKKAAENEGIDWKAVSHAVRAAYQVKELLTVHTITFPRPEAELLLAIKQGKMDFLTEVDPLIEKLMGEVEKLSEKTTLPAKPDRKFWNNFLIETIEREFYHL